MVILKEMFFNCGNSGWYAWNLLRNLMSLLKGGPLDILGGGVSDPKKKIMQEIELEKKIPACA